MTWQDIVFSVGSWIFIIALIPSLISKDKPPVSSSLLTGSVLLIYALTYTTLHFWLTVASTGLLAIAWLMLAIQKFLANRRARSMRQN